MVVKSTFALLALLLFPAAHAGPGELTYCRFGPKIKVLEPRKPDFSKQVCDGEVKIQGVLWECVDGGKVETTIARFKKTLKERGEAECTKFCAKLAPDCAGKFEPPQGQWLLTSREDAAVMGREFGCRKDCGGPSFAYASIYNVGYLTDDVAFIAKQPVNCKCSKIRRPK